MIYKSCSRTILELKKKQTLCGSKKKREIKMARDQLFEDEDVTECEERVDMSNDEKIDRSFSSSERLKEIDQIYASVEDRLQIAIQELAQIVKKDTSSFKLSMNIF